MPTTTPSPAPFARLWSRTLTSLRRRKSWQKKDGVYTWQGYGWGIDQPPRTLAYQYFNYLLTRQAVGERRFRRSLELGCGWGARTPWIAEYSAEAHALEPNADVLKDAREWFPGVKFEHASAQEMPYPDSHFDLAVSWTVLQHIPHESITAAAEELQRVLSDDCLLLLFEATGSKRSKPPTFRRTVEEYEALLPSLRLSHSIARSSVSGRDEEMQLLCFVGRSDAA